MKWKFRIIEETNKYLKLDNKTIGKDTTYYVEMKWDFGGWWPLLDCGQEKCFDTYDEAMEHLMKKVVRMWKVEKEERERRKVKKLLKKQLKPTKVIVGEITFTEKDLDLMLENMEKN